LSHRRLSAPQSEAVPFSNSPYLDPHPTTPVQLPLPAFKLPPTIVDGPDSSAVFHEENANGLPVETAKEHTGPCTFNDFSMGYSRQLLTSSYRAAVMPPDQTPEFGRMLELLCKCLDLRDKYMAASNQRLGDDPRDHDGAFHGTAEGISDVMGVRPEATGSCELTKEQFKPWHIYPRPPPPHWHWTADQAVSLGTASTSDVFDFTQFEIPGADEWEFEMDDKGIYQVYRDATGMSFSPHE
jgi:hypothetical protein